VVITSETSSAGAVTPSKLSADTVVAELAPGSVLSSLVGTGHAAFEQRTAAGVHQSSNSDQLDVRFVPATKTPGAPPPGNPAAKGKETVGDAQIASIVQVGRVVLVQDPAPARPGQAAQSQIRATASRSDYDGQSQILHLTGTPRVRDGALDMTANQIDFAQDTGDAFAHGDVKASWSEAGSQSPSPAGSGLLGGNGPGGNGLGGNGPVHAIAAEAELHQSTQEVIFRAADPSLKSQAGNLPRLWQAANSVSAPLITLNRQKQTLTAQADGAAKPVRTVLVSNPAPKSGPGTAESGKSDPGKTESKTGTKSKSDAPSVIRVRSGDLHYSEGERLALFHSGSVGSVTMETTETGGVATIVSRDAEVKLLPAGVHANRQNAGSGNESGGVPSRTNASVDQLISLGHVTVDWPDRKGTGEKLVYLSEDGTFTLTGTAAAPPRMTDQARGAVTGSVLIYHSRDGSVTVEGDGAKTATDTRTSKK
jgi:lipopolysaccharide export system protein LptA